MDLELKGKVVIVTGGNRGIGKAIGRVLATEGANVALIARNKAALDTAAAEISGQGGGQAKGFLCDTTDDAAVKGWLPTSSPPSGASTSW
jgi:NAD(P)-dependent dehydrogenase (short-subunit alcohol dehydrogenase family)